ncbi:MAG: hydrogenase nickel incorporation protein HypB [Cyanobacteria bacterium P01_E01_bin.34]
MHQIADIAGMNLLQANQDGADHNRAHFNAWGISCFNLMSSPGAGKTALLEKTLGALCDRHAIAVIEGDMTTQLDADRLRRFGVPVIPITTGRACHLDSKMVAGGMQILEQNHDPHRFDIVFVENVGNLVCPAEFEIGEHAKVALLSVTEGDDKPLKYPIMFREANCLLISKTDLAPYVDADIERIRDNVQAINPHATIIPISVKTGAGLDEWYSWLEHQLLQQRPSSHQTHIPHQEEIAAVI